MPVLSHINMSTSNPYSSNVEQFQQEPYPEYSSSRSGSPSSSPHSDRSPTSLRNSPRRLSHRERFRRERERTHSSTNARDLVRLLVNEEYESKQTKKLLYTALDRLEKEANRAKEAERTGQETIDRFRTLNNDKINAQQEAATAQEELRLYKLQFENAQRELSRAQHILGTVEAQRDEALTVASNAKSIARRLNEERLIQRAREEGRRMGYEEGLRRGQQLGYDDGRDEGYDDARGVAEGVVDRVLENETESDGDEELENLLQDPRSTIPAAGQNTRPLSITIPTPQPLQPTADAPLTPVSAATPRDNHSTVPPENWIPTADENSFIQMPAPHGMQPRPSSASIRRRSGSFGSRDSASSTSLGDLSRDLPPLPPPSDSSNGSRTQRTQGNRRSSNGSGSTTVSRLGRDLGILSPGGPNSNGVERNRNLSIIPEDSSQHINSPGSSAKRNMHIEFPVSPPGRASGISTSDRGNESGRQRYSENSNAPVSLNAKAIRDALGHGSESSRHRPDTSPEVGINIEPPSETPSSTGQPLRQSWGHLSPNDASRATPLPPTSRPPEREQVRTISPHGASASSPQTLAGALPEGFVPSTFVPNPNPQGGRRSPFKVGPVPLSPSGEIPPAHLPGTPGVWEPDWELNRSPLRPKTRHGKPLSPDESYSTAPILARPAPPVSSPTSTSNGGALQVPLPVSPAGSTASRKLRRRGQSQNVAVIPPRSPQQNSPSTPITAGGGPTGLDAPPLRRVSSSGSYARFVPETYNDPAFFGSTESLNDPSHRM